MSIRTKVLIVIGLVFTSFTLILYIAARLLLLSRFEDIERENVKMNLTQVMNAVGNEVHSLSQEVNDWSCWDATYDFAESHDSNYISSNLPDETFSGLHLDIVIIVNRNGVVPYTRRFDHELQKTVTDTTIIAELFDIQNLITLNSDKNQVVSGLVVLKRGVLLVASNTILTSERQGPGRGCLLMGRFLNSREIERLSELTHLPFQIESYSLQKHLHLNAVDSVKVTPVNKHIVCGTALLFDVEGKPAQVIKIELPRTLYNQGLSIISYILISIMVLGFSTAFLINLFFDKVVISRISLLNNFINRIAESGDLSARIPVKGKDELANFAKGMNAMVDQLERSQNELEDNRQCLFDIIDFFPDATLVINTEKKVIAWNKAMEEITGIAKKDILGKGDFAYAVPFYGFPRPMLVDLVFSDMTEIKCYFDSVQKKGSVLCTETRVVNLHGKEDIYIWATASPLLNKSGSGVGAIESIRDISERKKSERELKYLSLHDPLTGLYNRVYFEEEIHRLNIGRCETVGIVVCDLDGLKFINDTLGHAAGDNMLQAAATVIKDVFRKNDMVARIGGDEFAILVPNADSTILEGIGKRFRDMIELFNKDNPTIPLSISIGWAFRKDNGKEIKEVFEEADNNMYKAKLHQQQSTRSTIVQTLLTTLNVRDLITEEHGDRLKILVKSLGEKVGLPHQVIDNLVLFAQFHDIGKIGIPDNILQKPGKLDIDERRIMQRHSEIGFQIASSSRELIHISDWILKHHESWDGTGYPQGLKGEDIPLECRILSIADAYDAMISDRPYRKAMSHESAVNELRRCAGIQFDARLVELFIDTVREA